MRVLVITDGHNPLHQLAAALRAVGIESMQEMEGAIGMLRKVAEYQPDIILIDTASPSRDVLESLCVVSTHAPRPMVMFTADDSDDAIAAAMAAGVSVYSVEGISAERLKPIMRVATARFRQDRRLTEQLTAAERKIQERRLVDTAKGLLMARDGLSEEHAYRLLRQTAMRSRRSLQEMATELLTEFQR